MKKHVRYIMVPALLLQTAFLTSGCQGGAGNAAPTPLSKSIQAARQSLEEKIRKAPLLEPEVLGSPMRGTRGGGGIVWIPNPDGKTYDVMVRYARDYWGPHTSVSLDLATGKIYKHKRKKCLYGWSHIGPNGNMYVTVGKDIEIYNPGTNRWRTIKKPEGLGGEVKPICTGTDGMMYGAGSKDGRAFIYQLNPATDKITSYGAVGPSHAPNGCWGYSVAADARYVYVASGKIPWYLVAYNKATGKSTVLYTNKSKGPLSVRVDRKFNCSVVYSRERDRNKQFWLYDGALKEKRDGEKSPPFDLSPRQIKRPPPSPNFIWSDRMSKATLRSGTSRPMRKRNSRRRPRLPMPSCAAGARWLSMCRLFPPLSSASRPSATDA